MTNTTAPAARDLDAAQMVLVTFESRLYVARAAHRAAVAAHDRAERNGDDHGLALARHDVARTAGRYAEAREAFRIAKSLLG